ncbi:MAG: hypothetical protein FWD09_09480 [Lentimicrobiaceae bacterium]|nr:hypothetical protein [Lentimicrobiaceae bacterium]
MKRVVLNLVVVAAIATSAIFQFGCSKKAETSNEISNETIYVYQFGYSVPVAIVPKEELPEFLRESIDYFSGIYDEKPMICGATVEFFRGKWNKRTVYYFYNSYSSCAFCEVFYSDGTRLDWSKGDNFEDFWSKSTNWVLIYQIGQRCCDE